jgi:signal transduction histidine kinase
MKIKNKLTLLFVLIIALLLFALNIYIYSLSKSYASFDFFERLSDRAYASANIFLEEDESSQKSYKEFQSKYLDKLSGETIRILDKDNKVVFSSDSSTRTFPNTVISTVRKLKTYKSKINQEYLFGTLYNDNQGEFVILVSAEDKIGDSKLLQLRNVLVIGFLFSIIFVFYIGRFLTKQMLKPIKDIINQVNTITETNLHLRLNKGNGKDEIAVLAHTFNNMLGRIESAFEQQQNFVANASHELRTPLTSIIGNIDVTLSRDRSTDEYKSVLNTVLEEAERLHKLSDGLLNIAQAGFDRNSIQAESVRIDELLEEAKQIIHKQIPESNLEIKYVGLPQDAEELTIKGNKNLLLIGFENLYENATKFSNNRKVNIMLNNTAESMLITVSDTGIGIPEKDLRNIRQTFFRSENARTFVGSGIGLSLCQKIFSLHNGKLSISSAENSGTVVSVYFPKN